MTKHFISIDKNSNRFRGYKIQLVGDTVYTSNSRVIVENGKVFVKKWYNTRVQNQDFLKLCELRLKRGYVEHPIYLLDFKQLKLI